MPRQAPSRSRSRRSPCCDSSAIGCRASTAAHALACLNAPQLVARDLGEQLKTQDVPCALTKNNKMANRGLMPRTWARIGRIGRARRGEVGCATPGPFRASMLFVVFPDLQTSVFCGTHGLPNPCRIRNLSRRALATSPASELTSRKI